MSRDAGIVQAWQVELQTSVALTHEPALALFVPVAVALAGLATAPLTEGLPTCGARAIRQTSTALAAAVHVELARGWVERAVDTMRRHAYVGRRLQAETRADGGANQAW